MCSECTFNGIKDFTCTLCYAPYVLNNKYECVLCSETQYYDNNTRSCKNNNETCSKQIDEKTCIECNKGYYLQNNWCYQQDNNCIEHSITGCESCDGDTVMTNKGKCTLNKNNCKYQINSNDTSECLICQNNFIINNNNECISDSTCKMIKNDKCYKCEDNQINEDGKCKNYDKNYVEIVTQSNNETYELKCKEGYILNIEQKQCIEKTENNCNKTVGSYCVSCPDYKHNENGTCVDNKDKQCITIEGDNYCTNCKEINNHGECIQMNDINCTSLNNKQCLRCKEGYFKDTSTCKSISEVEEIEHKYCYHYRGTMKKCDECSEEYVLTREGYCYSKSGEPLETEDKNNTNSNQNQTMKRETKYKETNNCIERSTKGCSRCEDGYYLEDGECKQCIGGCWQCSNSTYCTGCDSYSYADNGKCIKIGELAETCSQLMPTHDGCVQCRDGYYKASDGKACTKCDSSCLTCFLFNGLERCIDCQVGYYRAVAQERFCLSQDLLINCTNKTNTGCSVCENGFFLTDAKTCQKCGLNCISCQNEKTCVKCKEENYVLKEGVCVDYKTIQHCKEAKNSKCTSCDDGFELSKTGLECNEIVKDYTLTIALSSGGGCLVLILVIVIVIIIIVIILHHKRVQKERERLTIFKMKESDIEMIELEEYLVGSATEIDFGNDIPVDSETVHKICIGNKSKRKAKIQFTTKEDCEKYTIRTEPALVTLNKGDACEFKVFIKPICTCQLKDEIVLTALDISNGKQVVTRIPIKCLTEFTTRLDYDELIENDKLGEGSFGVVFLGTFRGNKVAIKKMKQFSSDNKELDEFEKEVSMLEKFRNDYIIHFYGAVFIPGKICMVTEYAQHGSLQNLIKKRVGQPIYDRMKTKILIDGAKGIQYLHSNGILHRDIKPDNILVLSLEDEIPVNAKLTDFGSSRNINLLMTNMTFTKGIGTPVYMAPEILNRKHYKKPADIFAFAITMYETYIWKDVYPKSQFKFAWDIAEFVTNGKRMPQTNEISNEQYEIIKDSWKQDSNERLTIDEIVEKLTCEYEGKEKATNDKVDKLNNDIKSNNENEEIKQISNSSNVSEEEGVKEIEEDNKKQSSSTSSEEIKEKEEMNEEIKQSTSSTTSEDEEKAEEVKDEENNEKQSTSSSSSSNISSSDEKE